MADKFSAANAVIVLLLILSADLTLVFLGSENQYLSLFLVFMTGCISFAVVAPIQMLVIQTATGAEMIASAAIQASFNIGNALGAFLGGLPLVAGYSYASPNLIGIAMSLIGAGITLILILRKRKTAMVPVI